jgi:cob(I)alamin adenosyltransferase
MKHWYFVTMSPVLWSLFLVRELRSPTLAPGGSCMVVLNRIYTRTGDDGTTALGTGERRKKYDLRIACYGTVDETNAAIGLARLHTDGGSRIGLDAGANASLDVNADPDASLDAMLARIQNDLFDLGADLCSPETGGGGGGGAARPGRERLTVTEAQVTRLETEIDRLNRDLAPLRSFVLPGGTPAAASLHLARTVCRRAERLMVELADRPGEAVSAAALKYVNRLSDFLFVASRFVNRQGAGDVLWTPGQNR